MKKFLLLLIVTTNLHFAYSQNTFIAIIREQESGEALPGATAVVKGTSLGAVTDDEGKLYIQGIPDGRQTIVVSYIGYDDNISVFNFPLESPEPVIIYLEGLHEKLDEIVVSSTRGTRTIENIPTRVEFIAGEEMEEKGNMKPGDIRMMLNESTGIQTQQTSATSYNSSIRIQGLDGKYTQILKDGYPLYSGFSGGLSLLQIVPLDLQQVEVIKGASSTLYGGGAIAGLVNLISKVPGENRVLDFMLNGTTALGLDVSGFYSGKAEKTGTTLFASYNTGNPYDPAGIGLTAIPQFTRYTFNPRLFFYPTDRIIINAGFNSTIEKRIGGDIEYIENSRDSIHSYFEKNNTERFSTQAGIEYGINSRLKLNFKNSTGLYNRKIEVPGFIFQGKQISTFSEATFNLTNDETEWIGGLNLWTDGFDQKNNDPASKVDYNHVIYGAFLQNLWNASEKFSLETGLRADYEKEFGWFLLPRFSVLMKFNEKISSRFGGGMGYKIPTIFTEDAERVQFRNVLPLNESQTEGERSTGGNFDINYKTRLAGISLNVNTLLFYTKVKNPLVMILTEGMYEFRQPEGILDTRGIELNVKVTYGNFKLFSGYTLADVRQHYNDSVTEFPLVARHRLNNVLMYELEEKLKIGLELYYYSSQKLNDGAYGKPFFITGLMVEKIWENISVFVNFENFTDTRQTRFDTIYSGTITNPVFRDIYAPVDGFVINAGLKIRL